MDDKSLAGQFEELTAEAESLDIDIDTVGLFSMSAHAKPSHPIPSHPPTRAPRVDCACG